MAEARDGKIKNDESRPVVFQAIVSVPSFELWLLIHFQEVEGAIGRTDVFNRLRKHIIGYEKAFQGTFNRTESALSIAIQRGKRLKTRYRRLPGDDAFTDVHELVEVLRRLRD